MYVEYVVSDGWIISTPSTNAYVKLNFNSTVFEVLVKSFMLKAWTCKETSLGWLTALIVNEPSAFTSISCVSETF